MADRKQMESSKIDALYSFLSRDLQRMKAELMNEMRMSSVQMSSVYKEMQSDKDKSAQAISQEIRYSYKQNQTIYDGLTTLLTEDVAERLNAMAEKTASIEEMQSAIKESVASASEKIETLENVDAEALAETIKEKVAEIIPSLQESIDEIKYGYMQQQAVYDSLTALISGEVVSKMDDMQAKMDALQNIDSALLQLQEKLNEFIVAYEDNDYKAVIESVAEKTEESVAEHSRQVLDAVASLPVAENVDYNRIVDEVGDKVLELLSEIILPEENKEPVEAIVDYDKIIYGTAEKVVESLPYPDKVDYRRIDESFAKSAEKITAQVSEDALASAVSSAVADAIANLDTDALASAVAEKIVVPAVSVPEIDYERLASAVAEKIPAVEVPEVKAPEIDYERLADMVAERLANRPCEEPTYELVVDEEGIDAIANKVSEVLCQKCAECEEADLAQIPDEEPVVEETVVEEPVVEEVVEEVVEAPLVEEPVVEELAVAEEPVFEEVDNQLVDAETGLVVRLKKSFTAKMKQSEDRVKQYYSDIKNELKSYKKINSNVSWHGDRFNFGRDTIAKVNICGKTLCFYIALDPENPEYKQTVFHQRNVGEQKAYENTPFMIKVKSDGAAKKALRLVGFLAEKIGAVKAENFEAVDYVEEFAYASTKELFDEGYIKATKEKKVELDF